MAIAMVAMLAFGGTYAYFTDKVTGITAGNATTGIIKLGSGTKFSETTTLQNVVPTESIFTDGISLEIEDNSNREAYIFITFDITCADVSADDLSKLQVAGLTEGAQVNVKISGTASDPITLKKGTVQVPKTGGSEGETENKVVYYILTSESENRNMSVERTYTISGLNATLSKDAGNEWQNKTITITASVEIIQAKGVSLQEAYDAQKVQQTA